MHTHWINLLVASGPAHSTAALDKALNSTANAVDVTVHTVQTTTVHAVGHWDTFRKDLGDTMRDILRPVYDWCIDDTLVPSAVSVSPFAAPTPSPSAFWNAAVVARPSSPSSSYISDSLPTSSAAPMPKRVPLPTPAYRLKPNVIVGGWGRWNIAPPTATPAPTTSFADRSSPSSTFDSRLGPVVMPRVADSHPLPPPSFIGPRLPTSPIGSYNGTELPVPCHTSSPDDRPPRPRYIWTRRPQCLFNNGNLPDYVACPFPAGLSKPHSIFLDPSADPRDPIIDLGLALDTILPIYINSIVTPKRLPLPPLRRTSFRDSIWFKVGGGALTLAFAYVLYRGAGYDAANVKPNKTIQETLPPSCPPRRRRAAARAIQTQVHAPVVDAARIGYLDIVKGTIYGFFTRITRIFVGSCSLVIKTVAACFVGIIGLFIGLWNSVLRAAQSLLAGVIGMIISLWNWIRNVFKWIFAYISLPRSTPRRVAEQPTSPLVQSTTPSAQPQERSPMNSANAQTTQQPEAGPSNSQNPLRLRSLPPGVADAIRTGNTAPSQVRRAGGRRVNRARPARAATPSTSA